MKDLLVAIIQSVFKYIVNPTVWSRVATDINAPPSQATPEAIQRVQSILEPDPRDVNVSRALDLANQQMQFILERSRMVETQSSGIEVLPIRGRSVENSSSDVVVSTSSETPSDPSSEPSNEVQQTNNGITPTSDGSGDSYEEFADDEIIVAHNLSIVSIGSATQSGELSSEYGATLSSDDISSSKSDKSVATTASLDSMNSSDSVEVLSISSDTPAP